MFDFHKISHHQNIPAKVKLLEKTFNYAKDLNNSRKLVRSLEKTEKNIRAAVRSKKPKKLVELFFKNIIECKRKINQDDNNPVPQKKRKLTTNVKKVNSTSKTTTTTTIELETNSNPKSQNTITNSQSNNQIHQAEIPDFIFKTITQISQVHSKPPTKKQIPKTPINTKSNRTENVPEKPTTRQSQPNYDPPKKKQISKSPLYTNPTNTENFPTTQTPQPKYKFTPKQLITQRSILTKSINSSKIPTKTITRMPPPNYIPRKKQMSKMPRLTKFISSKTPSKEISKIQQSNYNPQKKKMISRTPVTNKSNNTKKVPILQAYQPKYKSMKRKIPNTPNPTKPINSSKRSIKPITQTPRSYYKFSQNTRSPQIQIPRTTKLPLKRINRSTQPSYKPSVSKRFSKTPEFNKSTSTPSFSSNILPQTPIIVNRLNSITNSYPDHMTSKSINPFPRDALQSKNISSSKYDLSFLNTPNVHKKPNQNLNKSNITFGQTVNSRNILSFDQNQTQNLAMHNLYKKIQSLFPVPNSSQSNNPQSNLEFSPNPHRKIQSSVSPPTVTSITPSQTSLPTSNSLNLETSPSIPRFSHKTDPKQNSSNLFLNSLTPTTFLQSPAPINKNAKFKQPINLSKKSESIHSNQIQSEESTKNKTATGNMSYDCLQMSEKILILVTNLKENIKELFKKNENLEQEKEQMQIQINKLQNDFCKKRLKLTISRSCDLIATKVNNNSLNKTDIAAVKALTVKILKSPLLKIQTLNGVNTEGRVVKIGARGGSKIWVEIVNRNQNKEELCERTTRNMAHQLHKISQFLGVGKDEFIRVIENEFEVRIEAPIKFSSENSFKIFATLPIQSKNLWYTITRKITKYCPKITFPNFRDIAQHEKQLALTTSLSQYIPLTVQKPTKKKPNFTLIENCLYYHCNTIELLMQMVNISIQAHQVYYHPRLPSNTFVFQIKSDHFTDGTETTLQFCTQKNPNSSTKSRVIQYIIAKEYLENMQATLQKDNKQNIKLLAYNSSICTFIIPQANNPPLKYSVVLTNPSVQPIYELKLWLWQAMHFFNNEFVQDEFPNAIFTLQLFL